MLPSHTSTAFFSSHLNLHLMHDLPSILRFLYKSPSTPFFTFTPYTEKMYNRFFAMSICNGLIDVGFNVLGNSWLYKADTDCNLCLGANFFPHASLVKARWLITVFVIFILARTLGLIFCFVDLWSCVIYFVYFWSFVLNSLPISSIWLTHAFGVF